MKLSRADLMSLEQYSSGRRIRPGCWRTSATGFWRWDQHQRCFEDRLTIQYQVQEMLRVERIFEAEGIQDEIDTYNPLIPDGSNWKVTFLIEYPDINERRVKLNGLKGIEDRCWVQVDGFDRVYSIADEDLERENDEKTSAVHFMRFELSTPMAAAVREGAAVSVGIDHPNYNHEVRPLPKSIRDSLAADLRDV